MDLIDGLQKLAPWASKLPLIPKIALSAITVCLNVLFVGLIWTPPRDSTPESDQSVMEAYLRMQKILGGLYKTDGKITFEGRPVSPQLESYYRPYVEIATFIREHPNDIKGAYEEIWKYGGEGRTIIDDTTAFEAVVSRFFREFETAKNSAKKPHDSTPECQIIQKLTSLDYGGYTLLML
jgi:hypothetical protein